MRPNLTVNYNSKRNSSEREATALRTRDQTIETFAPNRWDEALDVAVLPRCARAVRWSRSRICPNELSVA